MNVVAHPDVAVTRRLAPSGLATFARFSVMHGTPTGPYAAAGPGGAVVEKLQTISALGIEKVIAVGPTAGSDATEGRRAQQALAENVLPALR